MSRTARPVTVPLDVPTGAGPLSTRIADAVVAEVRTGRLRPGDHLPSSRALAADLGVSRGVVVSAFDELVAAGYLDARPGSGSVLAPGADRAARAGAATHVTASGSSNGRVDATPTAAIRWTLQAGRPDTGLIDPADWRRAWRASAAAPIDDDSSVRTGHPELELALCDHLRRARGVVVEPDHVIVVPGVAAAVRAVAAAAGLRGSQVAMEDPGYGAARDSLVLAGAVPRPVPVDADGLDVTELRARDRAAYVTPAHQYPLGGRMPGHRRADLLSWASDHGALVIEDDYDGEFRFGVPPLPALRSMTGARDHVVYLGTASKILTPSIRVAWVVPPGRLVGAVRDAVAHEGLGVDRMAGHALAHLLSTGAMSRHLARTSRHYAARRGALVTALTHHLPDLRLVGVDAGLHLVGLLPEGTDDVDLARRLSHVGVGVQPLSISSVADTRRGLVLGYARLPESQAEVLVTTMAPVVAPYLTRA
jgi:GntR family transcriptional regulator/MocR family aminotransferase